MAEKRPGLDAGSLGAHGIHGNGHLLTIERNRDEIAELIERWFINQTA